MKALGSKKLKEKFEAEERSWENFFASIHTPAYDVAADLAEQVEELKEIFKEQNFLSTIEGRWVGQGLAYIFEIEHCSFGRRSPMTKTSIMLSPVEANRFQIIAVSSCEDNVSRKLFEYDLSSDDDFLPVYKDFCKVLISSVSSFVPRDYKGEVICESDAEKLFHALHPNDVETLSNVDLVNRYSAVDEGDHTHKTRQDSIRTYFDTQVRPRNKGRREAWEGTSRQDKEHWNSHRVVRDLRVRTCE